MHKSHNYLHPLVYLLLFSTLGCAAWVKSGPIEAWLIVTFFAMFHLLHAIVWEAFELESWGEK